MIYRLGFEDNMSEHQGYEFYGTKEEARNRVFEAAKHGLKVSSAERVPVSFRRFTKRDLLRLLNLFGDHPDNG